MRQQTAARNEIWRQRPMLWLTTSQSTLVSSRASMIDTRTLLTAIVRVSAQIYIFYAPQTKQLDWAEQKMSSWCILEYISHQNPLQLFLWTNFHPLLWTKKHRLKALLIRPPWRVWRPRLPPGTHLGGFFSFCYWFHWPSLFSCSFVVVWGRWLVKGYSTNIITGIALTAIWKRGCTVATAILSVVTPGSPRWRTTRHQTCLVLRWSLHCTQTITRTTLNHITRSKKTPVWNSTPTSWRHFFTRVFTAPSHIRHY